MKTLAQFLHRHLLVGLLLIAVLLVSYIFLFLMDAVDSASLAASRRSAESTASIRNRKM